MAELVESISTFGVINPVIVRKGEGERYELISGHRRKYACAKLGIDTLPVIVRDLSREEAIIFMVDSNLQREHILRNVFDTWEQNKDKRLTQMVFCDLSTPKGDGKFNVYDDMRDKLVAMGIPREEIAFIHTADTDAKKKELFAKVRAGQVRILMGSTFKMGAGTNVYRAGYGPDRIQLQSGSSDQ